MPVKAIVSNISRCSLHDGPGVRTVVYLKGCGLHCQWCHNPETFLMKTQILYAPIKCICCGRCIDQCPEHHIVKDGRMVFVREGCVMCGKCAEVCPSGALLTVGEEKSSDSVFEEIIKDKQYYESSGGGVTFSGGECLLWPEFVEDLARRCKEIGIHTAMETSLFVPWENLDRVIPYIDIFFADMKLPDPEKHRKYTGHDNKLIMENLRRLSCMDVNIIIRIPVIPGVNDSEDDIKKFAKNILSLSDGVRGIELLKYNNLAKGKYDLLDMRYVSFADNTQSDEKMERLRSSLKTELNEKFKVS